MPLHILVSLQFTLPFFYKNLCLLTFVLIFLFLFYFSGSNGEHDCSWRRCYHQRWALHQRRAGFAPQKHCWLRNRTSNHHVNHTQNIEQWWNLLIYWFNHEKHVMTCCVGETWWSFGFSFNLHFLKHSSPN